MSRRRRRLVPAAAAALLLQALLGAAVACHATAPPAASPAPAGPASVASASPPTAAPPAAAASSAPPAAPPAAEERPVLELAGGHWFDGSGFEPRTVYVVDGRIAERRPPRVDRRLDLAGGFVVPPFGEAHNHNFEKTWNLERQIDTYLGLGIFYVKIANSIRELNATIRHRLNRPDSVDVVFANGGITSPGGHPARLYQEILREPAYQGVAREWFEGRAYHTVDSLDDLDRKWPAIRSQPPDFVKVFLLYSDEHATRRASEEYFGRRGLDPALLPSVVERAHAEGLRVAVHVETAADFHQAVTSGADEITHLPGYLVPASQPPERYLVDPADAALAARRGTVVATTTVLARRRIEDPERLAKTLGVQRHNLRLLHGAGVTLAVGSDDYSLTSADEIEHLRSLGVFDDLTLLRLWSQSTPRAIFPGRRIGTLEVGAEADFLVLAGNPLEDFTNLRRIRLAVKGGWILRQVPELPHDDESATDAATAGEAPRR